MMSLMQSRAARATLVVLAFAAVMAAGPVRQATAESPHDTLTEWTIPFADMTPLWIAAAGNDIVFSNYDVVTYVGRLETDSGLVTRWQTPYRGTVPSAIAVRPTDGAVFFTGATYPNDVFQAEIGQLDLASGLFRHWPMPAGEGLAPAGPLHLTVAPDGSAIFQTYDLVLGFPFVGRLDPATGDIKLWCIFASSTIGIWQVAPGPGSTVFGNFSGDGGRGFFRLDLATGALTIWPTGAVDTLYAVATDTAGNVYSPQSIGTEGNDWMISRLEPATGRLTQWSTRPDLTGQLVFADGHAWFGKTDGLVALDVSHPGTTSWLAPSPVTTVTPASFTVAPGEVTLIGETAPAAVSVSPIARRHHSAFDTWTAAGGAYGIAITSSPPAVYFNEPQSVIARITN